jgi:hypothetical protein
MSDETKPETAEETETGAGAAKSGGTKSAGKPKAADGAGDGKTSGKADVKNKADEPAPEVEGTPAETAPQEFPEEMYTGDESETESAEERAAKFKSTLHEPTGAMIGVEGTDEGRGGRREAPADIGGTVESDSEEQA